VKSFNRQPPDNRRFAFRGSADEAAQNAKKEADFTFDTN
jgi:hypothetical protein